MHRDNDRDAKGFPPLPPPPLTLMDSSCRWRGIRYRMVPPVWDLYEFPFPAVLSFRRVEADNKRVDPMGGGEARDDGGMRRD